MLPARRGIRDGVGAAFHRQVAAGVDDGAGRGAQRVRAPDFEQIIDGRHAGIGVVAAEDQVTAGPLGKGDRPGDDARELRVVAGHGEGTQCACVHNGRGRGRQAAGVFTVRQAGHGGTVAGQVQRTAAADSQRAGAEGVVSSSPFCSIKDIT